MRACDKKEVRDLQGEIKGGFFFSPERTMRFLTLETCTPLLQKHILGSIRSQQHDAMTGLQGQKSSV